MTKGIASPLLVVRVNVEQAEFNIDAVDARVYCINTSESDLLVTLASESFITIDEESGDTADDTTSDKFKLAPGEVRLISEILGWEWDGHVGMKITYAPAAGGKPISKTYNFKSGSGDYRIESLKLEGRVVPGI